jgi:putative MATE family efflux protein
MQNYGIGQVSSSNSLSTARIGTLLFRLSIPSMIALLVNSMYQVVDTIFVGRSIGPVANAALGISLPIHMIITAIALMFGIGSASIVSRKLGALKPNEAAMAAGNALKTTLISVSVIAVVFLFLLEPLLRGFGASDVVLPYAKDYLGILLIGAPFAAITSCSNAIIRAEGRAKVAMSVILIGNGLNCILDPLFIMTFGWGMRGAAVATVLSQAIGTLYILRYFTTHRTSIHFTRSSFKLQKPIVMAIVVLGLPTIMRQAGTSFMMLAVNNTLGIFGGDIAIAAYGLISVLSMFLNMPISGVVQGLQPIVGYNYGARHSDRVMSVLKKAIIATTAMGFFFMLIVLSVPKIILSVFTKDIVLIDTATLAIRIVLLTVPLLGFQSIGAAYFQSVGKALPSLALWLIRQFLLLIPLVLLLPNLWGVKGVWLAFPLADSLAALITFLWLRTEIRNTRNTMQHYA